MEDKRQRANKEKLQNTDDTLSNVSGTIIGDGNYQDGFYEPEQSRTDMGINFQYNYQGASLEKNDAENTPELTKPVFP